MGRVQGQLHVAGVYVGAGSTRLGGEDTIAELRELKRFISVCYFFSKKPWDTFLSEAGYGADDVLLRSNRVGLLKPAFTIVVDHSVRCILVIVRGTHSMKDTLTVVTGATVPFHHALLDGDGVHRMVLGYAHCGMAAAARFIAVTAEATLLAAREIFPLYALKVSPALWMERGWG